jgi:hypothetical protein
MSTHCGIGIYENGTYTLVYCHHDGYPQGAGAILLAHYGEPEVRELLRLGDLSCLGERISPQPGEKHTFDDAQDDVCVFYARDRHEPKDTVSARPYDEIPRGYAYVYAWDTATGRWLWASRGEFEGLRELTPDDCG